MVGSVKSELVSFLTESLFTAFSSVFISGIGLDSLVSVDSDVFVVVLMGVFVDDDDDEGALDSFDLFTELFGFSI